jgi:two-component system cell cycle sensor histidine kinase/response regulator CckA
MLSRRTAKLAKRRRRQEEQPRSAQTLEAIGLLVGGVAHEFNNLLMGIGGYAQMLLAGAAPGSEAAKDLGRIHELTKRAAGLTRDLQLLNRRDHPERTALDLNSVVDGAGKMLRRLLPGNVAVEVRLAACPVPVLADPGQLRHALFSLAANARGAMPVGGRFLVEVSNVDREPTASGLDPGRYAIMTVTGAGCGTDAATPQRSVDPSLATKDISQGAGLELSTACEIVRQHGGQITVHGERGRGTTFRVYLPCLPENEASGVLEWAMEQKGEHP